MASGARDDKAKVPVEWLLGLVDKALTIGSDAVVAVLKRARKQWPDADPATLLKTLERSYLGSMTGGGAAVGGAAAARGLGTGASIALSLGETATFLEASLLLSLASAEIRGVSFDGLDQRRMLLFTIMLGNSGSSFVELMAARTGRHWGLRMAEGVPLETIKAINKVLGPRFVTRYGTRQGIVVLGRSLPFGVGAAIGGVGNYLIAQTVVSATRKAFGPAPESWPTRLYLSSDEPGDTTP
ncbi:hypothetical protein [Promicromonospora sp. NPDC090134]|uniref:hypothetical protein n=1 Tax=Promicromonospora sp. NPDC090134 TaxID=3364408 RepID=UPI0037FE0DEF